MSADIKLLEWLGDENVGWSAYGAGFGYYIEDESGQEGCFILERHELSAVTKSLHGSIGDAQSYAQAHFNGVIRAALAPQEVEVEAGLSTEEMKAQAKRCSCRGADDYCPCQNVPDGVTRRERMIAARKDAASL